MAKVFPTGFEALEPHADWAVHGEGARYNKRVNSTMSELQAFYDVVQPRTEEAMAYLEQYSMDKLPEEGKRLLWLYCALITVSFAVEAWRQPRVPDSGPAEINAISEPLI